MGPTHPTCWLDSRSSGVDATATGNDAFWTPPTRISESLHNDLGRLQNSDSILARTNHQSMHIYILHIYIYIWASPPATYPPPWYPPPSPRPRHPSGPSHPSTRTPGRGALALHTLYRLHIHSIHNLYTTFTHPTYILYTVYFDEMYILYTPYIHSIYTLCTFSKHFIYILYTLYIRRIYTIHSVRTFYALFTCPL